MPCRRPTSRLASCWNAVGVRSTLPGAHPGQVSATVTVTDLPSGPVTTIWRPHIGFLRNMGVSMEKEMRQDRGKSGLGHAIELETHAFGLAPAPGKLVMVATSTATMKSASVLKKPHEPRPAE